MLVLGGRIMYHFMYCVCWVCVMGGFVCGFCPSLGTWYLPRVSAANEWRMSYPYGWMEIICRCTHCYSLFITWPVFGKKILLVIILYFLAYNHSFFKENKVWVNMFEEKKRRKKQQQKNIFWGAFCLTLNVFKKYIIGLV